MQALAQGNKLIPSTDKLRSLCNPCASAIRDAIWQHMSPASEQQGSNPEHSYEVIQPETLGIGFTKGLDRTLCFTIGIVY